MDDSPSCPPSRLLAQVSLDLAGLPAAGRLEAWQSFFTSAQVCCKPDRHVPLAGSVRYTRLPMLGINEIRCTPQTVTLQTRVHAVFGERPGSVIWRERMRACERHLAHGDPAVSIAQLAEQHGFAGEAQFNRAFRLVYGELPADDRRRIQAQQLETGLSGTGGCG